MIQGIYKILIIKYKGCYKNDKFDLTCHFTGHVIKVNLYDYLSQDVFVKDFELTHLGIDFFLIDKYICYKKKCCQRKCSEGMI